MDTVSIAGRQPARKSVRDYTGLLDARARAEKEAEQRDLAAELEELRHRVDAMSEIVTFLWAKHKDRAGNGLEAIDVDEF